MVEQAYFAILDFMHLDSFFAWNMSAEEAENRFKVKRSEYYAVLAEEMIAYVDTTGGEDVGIQVTLPENGRIDGHEPIPANHKERMRCAVFKLEEKWMRASKIKQDYGDGSRQQRHLAVCDLCSINAHSLPVQWQRNIFLIEPLKGMSCFQIAHSEHRKGLWTGTKRENNTTLRKGKVVKNQSYRVSTAHPVYKSLMESYGYTQRGRRKRTRMDKNNEAELDNAIMEGYESWDDDTEEEIE
jgi:hypothetical protein